MHFLVASQWLVAYNGYLGELNAGKNSIQT